jgi:hypothetical protein
MDDNANCGNKQPFPTSRRTGVNETCAGVDKGRVIIVTELESYLAFFGQLLINPFKMPSPKRQRSSEYSLDKESCSLNQ